MERGGEVRSFHVASVNAVTLSPIMVNQIAQDTNLMTDEAAQYLRVGKHFQSHGVVRHNSGKYGRDPIHTNTIDSYFSLFKRGLVGTYHHVAPKHLKRYVREFDFRYSARKETDAERATSALKGLEGKRLTYRRPVGQPAVEYVVGSWR